ncbi:MAG: tetratricopeptide repeat protein [Pseudomonadota bacterium]|nr:tetratricopeptide repeat protein [Pseudomonadota bacterium]
MTFLRPWFLLLIAVPFIFKLFKEYTGAESPWRKVIDEQLLPFLLVRGSNATTKQRRLFKTVLWIMLSVALAGPAWDKVEAPAHTHQPGTIIVLELGPTMTGENLTRAQQKIYDILDLLKGEQVGLVLYDRYGYTAGPLTFDTDIIRAMVPYLDDTVLPEKASDPVAGFEQAEKLFQNAGIEEGRILFLTTGALGFDGLADILKSTPHKVGILGIGPAEPHPIARPTGGFFTDSSGKPLMVYFDPAQMKQFGAFQVLTPDDSDVQFLIDETIPKISETERITNQTMVIWRDRGGMIVAFLLPFFALLFRKSIVLLLLIFLIRPAEASLWLRPDQEAYRHQMNGVSLYRRADYVRAERVFKSGSDVDALYNKGNALAFQQKIPEAIAAYKEALKKDPKHADARYNKEYLEKEQEKQKQNSNSQNNQNNSNSSQSKQDQQNSNSQNNQNNSNNSQNKQDNQDQQNPNDPQNKQDKQNPQNPNNPQDKQNPQNKQDNQDQQNPNDPQDNQVPPPNHQNPSSTTNVPPPFEAQPDTSSPDTFKSSPPPQLSQENPPLEPELTQADPSVFDQESEKILNILPPEKDNVLRYRIRQQYNRYKRN